MAAAGEHISSTSRTPDPDSYTEVIEYLEGVKKDLPNKRIIVSHRRYGGLFVRHERGGRLHGHTIDEAIAFVGERRDQMKTRRNRGK